MDMNLAMLQLWTRHCGASDLRDKVLALMNICIPSDLANRLLDVCFGSVRESSKILVFQLTDEATPGSYLRR